MHDWPPWWDWDLELSPHLLKRMFDRQCTETDLRTMLADARGYHDDIEPGRFLIETVHDDDSWEVIVEPDDATQHLVVVTAYPLIG